MNLMTIKEIKNLDTIDINKTIQQTKQTIFELKFKKETRQTIKPHLIKNYKKMLARLLTINHSLNNL